MITIQVRTRCSIITFLAEISFNLARKRLFAKIRYNPIKMLIITAFWRGNIRTGIINMDEKMSLYKNVDDVASHI